MKLKLIFILALFVTKVLYSAGYSDYFPLNAGNVWYYKTTFSPIPFPPVFHREHIEKDTIINGITYFKYYRYGYSYIRIDSLNGNLLVYAPGDGCGSYPDDKIMDSLASVPGDQIICFYQAISSRLCISEETENVFGITSDTKEFYHDGLIIVNVEYAKNFGVIHSCSGEPPPCSGFTNLIGCKIDGVVYGDTNLTNIVTVNSALPDEFSLSQNYPNPFNPSTVIRYSIHSSSFGGVKGQMSNVRLVLFNSLGMEVAILVDEYQNPGSYQVSFDGSDFPSGIYLYKLEADNFSETKRMILLK